jgi:hypothetical protein
MPNGFDEVCVDTRRQLRGVAESPIAGRPDAPGTRSGTSRPRPTL